MRLRALVSLCLALAASLALLAQDRDFLTVEEVDMVRLKQEPNERLTLYLTFAQSRVAQIEQLIARDRPGRSALIHDLLEDYTDIIDAIDTVSDDALSRRLDISVAMLAVATAEKDLVARLKKFADAEPADMARYEFVLEDAIETTEDSIELAMEDLRDRTKDVLAKEQRKETEREAGLTPEESKERQETKAKEAKQQRKAPTLRRPGDPPPRDGSTPKK